MGRSSAYLALGLLALTAAFVLSTAATCSPYFLIDTEPQWQDALAASKIKPLIPPEWDDYMNQWSAFLADGDPYPTNSFVTPDLYVYGGGGGGGLDPEDAGLVMTWGNMSMPDGEYSAAYRWDYQLDPDLTNCTITVTVTAPQFDPVNGVQINTVSFGIQDITGAICSWQWNCGPAGPIQWNIPTTITINTALIPAAGVNAAVPAASGFAFNPAFNIVTSQFFIVDENGTWVGGSLPAPPPGGGLPGLWNYWHNIMVTPNIPPKGTGPVKWSQPPVEWQPGLQPPVFWGWDERSSYYWRPIVADDWECTDQRPVTDIHWWGSFIGWDQPDPPQLPIAFRIGIWTDVPASPPDVPFSHPGKLVWENFCQTYQWNFAGYDKDPRGLVQNEACFQFNQWLNPEEYFYQNPGPNGKRIYWLSISAIYSSEPPYPWGWKSRPHFFNDDAVRIFEVVDAAGNLIWPPTLGSTWSQGEPIEWEGVSWDMSFELTTLEEVAENDLGDAPDSSNNSGVQMTAYPSGGPPGVVADYPTVFQTGSPPHGPIHWQPLAAAYLGNAVSLENEADIGPDQDPSNNIIPPSDTPDLDLFDDGVQIPLSLPHCQRTTFNYTVTVVDSTQTMYANVWFDWNRDGDWDDTMDCSGTPAPEWAVQNQVLAGLPAGPNNITTPAFLPWHPTADPTEIWMRITISEQPWQPVSGTQGFGGSGPSAGYQYGETEDYYFIPEIPVEDVDWGDAPDGTAAPLYPTYAANNGANHIIGGPILGAAIDAELDGQPDPNALGDDNNGVPDDEDGVVFTSPIIPGSTATVDVTVSQACMLDAWVDFGADNSWAEAIDQIFASTPLNPGLNNLSFAVPTSAKVGAVSFARFRVSVSGGLSYVGNAPDGEVEDYKVRIGYKWLQKPDLTPTGIDVNATDRFILADDFKCAVTGPITDIHIWGSWYHDYLPMGDPHNVRFVLSIHKDIPATQNPDGYSIPGEPLWWREFLPTEFTATAVADQINEGWMDPPEAYEFPGDHVCWRYDFLIDQEQFIQEGSPEDSVIYWLDVQAFPEDPEARFGWKTSLEHWNDDAVWGQGVEPYPGPWKELRYPPGHQMYPESIDLAFAITGNVQPGLLTVKYNHSIPDHFWWPGDPDPDNEMISLLLAADPTEAISWDTVTLQASGTGNDWADIAAVNVWLDNDNDGNVSAGDALVGTGTYPADNGTTTIMLAPAPIVPAAGQIYALITYTMAASAVPGDTFFFDVIGVTGTGQSSGGPAGINITPYPLTSAVKTVGPDPITIGEAKKRAVITPGPFLLMDKEITADFLPPTWPIPWTWFYIEEPDRSAGIGVIAAFAGPVNIGDRVSILCNAVLVNSSELMMQPTQVLFSTHLPTITPLGMNNKWTGGGVFGAQPAVYDDASPLSPKQSVGLNNVGSLIRTWGKVTGYGSVSLGGASWVDVFWMDDGTGLADGYTTSVPGGPSRGIAVVTPRGIPAPPPIDSYWGVTGILRAIQSPMPWGFPVRLLVPRDYANDMIQYAP